MRSLHDIYTNTIYLPYTLSKPTVLIGNTCDIVQVIGGDG